MTDRSFTDWILHFSSTVEEWVLELSESLWIYPGIAGVSMVDGFFPVVPSESVVIATSTTSYQTGSPILPLILVCAALGAWLGDQIAYLIGAKANIAQWRLFKRDRWRRSLDWAETQLERRGTTFIIAARFVPGGRVVVNLAAGALRFPHRRFMGVDAIGASMWAIWSVALGTIAGAIFPEDNLVLSIVIGVIAGVVFGFFVDRILGWFGLTSPDLPDLVSDIEANLTPEERERAAEAERLRLERREHRAEHRAERRESFTGQIPLAHRRRTADPEGDDPTASADDSQR
ncbi:DedA family protein [Demequina sp. NBRC 110055]|uniref:DedA family protein n=1 Tax=Demequina sp. NBRC 110055 TaxID=1570344 RepID=UPI0009FD2C01|nr:DedA family protein [Demequina sp. NBRC 110055]